MSWQPKNNQQRTALTRVDKWMKDPSSQVFYLGGYAGTGKTELAKHFASGVNGDVCFGAFTGKAVLVLLQRGCFNARTIHSWLYAHAGHGSQALRQLQEALAELKQQEDAPPPDIEALEEQIATEQAKADQPNWRMKEDSALRYAALVVLDECSMIDKRIGNDLLQVCKKILVLGDPAQLPPVKGSGFFTARDPDYLLTNVVRHDNGILHVATGVREGKVDLPFGQINEDVVKYHKQDLALADYAQASQLITGRNAARRSLNIALRRVNGRQGILPVAGDRVICLKNSWSHALVNGQIETVVSNAVELDIDCCVFALDGHIIPDENGEPSDGANASERLYRAFQALPKPGFQVGRLLGSHGIRRVRLRIRHNRSQGARQPMAAPMVVR